MLNADETLASLGLSRVNTATLIWNDLCTIYNGALQGDQGRRARIALMMFNDVILRTALQFSLGVIDLQLVCSERSDFANPIEPSGTGGQKIAEAIARALGAAGDPARRATLSAD